MTPEQPAPVPGAPLEPSATERSSGAALRGPAVAGTGRTLGLITAGVVLAVAAVIIVVGVIAATQDNARIDRMKARGVPVSITVADCIGNLGGSGSNGAGYTCRGDYAVAGTTYHEVIGGTSAFTDPGTALAGVADPAQPSTVIVAHAVATSETSSTAYVILGLLSLVWLALVGLWIRALRRPTVPAPARAPSGSPQER